ncbi:MAG TPA: DNA polymerase I [Thermodesulfovibrionales bacterium]|nr:DNA polymerase I [Thermodesulfovibrionales bacterium]
MHLYLIDGNSYVYRAFYAIKGLTNSKGFPTNAIYGFTNMLMKIIREKKPDGIAVFFDSPVPTERHRIFEGYKAHRPETPGELVQQLPAIRKVISAFQIKMVEMPGYEADDLLCTMAEIAAKKGAEVFLVTSDKDMLQVVGERIKVYDPIKDKVMDEEYVRERFGVGPERVPEFMALTGDAVDNIPGIKGIGEKTARELLAGVKDLEELLDHPEAIKKERLRNLVSENTDLVRMSKKLATIDTAVPIDMDVDEIGMREPSWSELLSLFREFEFGSLMKLIPSAKSERQYESILSMEQCKEIFSSLHGSFALDIEATGKDPLRDRIVGLALCREPGKAYYIPFGHSYEGAPEQLDRREVLRMVSGILENPGIPKIGHNLKYDIGMLRQERVEVQGILYDTMIASYLINPNKPDHNLEDVSFEYLSYRKKSFQEVVGKKRSFSEVPLEEATSYAAEDAALAMELKGALFERLKEEDLDALYFDIEMPLIHVLIDMEEAGFKVDVAKLNDMSKELSREIESIQKRIHFLAGEEFNINSPKQLSKVLFHSLGLKPGKKTKTGFSTELSVLEDLAESHELPGEILNYRSLSKLKSTYTDVLPDLVNLRTGRIHTSFNQTATATGRLSSSEPNLQNIPVRGEWGRRIRDAFIAEQDNLILSADYSQIELRILAHLSKDQGLIDAFMSGVDIHTRTASALFGVAMDKVTSEMRRVAKTVNFGVVYGISPFGLSAALTITPADAKRYIDGYFTGHPGVKAYIEQTLSEAKEKGFVLTMFGRKRKVPEIKSQNAITKAQGERLAINSPIQGTAADAIKIAMIRIRERFRHEKVDAKMILQVHDELVFELPGDELDRTTRIVRETMEGAVSLLVPLKVDIGYGKSWAEAHG